MSDDKETRQEAIDRLARSASALEARTTRAQAITGEQAASQAYRIIAELVGGVLVGLAAGFIFDRFAHTTPWGLIGGVLAGFALSIWMARRTANRLMAQAKQEAEANPPAPPAPYDAEEDEER